MSGKNYAGNTYLARFADGTAVRYTYSADGSSVRIETVAGPGTGAPAEEVLLQAAEVAPSMYFLSWVEASGRAVSQVLNLNDNLVNAFTSWQSDGGGRQGSLSRGFLEQVAQS